MRTVRNLAVMLLCILAAPVLAQSQKWAGPKCELKPGHYLVNGGLLHLQNATNTRFDDQRSKELQDAQKNLTQALTTGGQEKNPAAWYYLGRYYILMNDAPGMDSAFNKTEALKPDCKTDTDFWRRYLWVPTFNAGVAAWQANNTDSAIASFRRASALLPQEPTSFKYLATLFYNAAQADSMGYVPLVRVGVDIEQSVPDEPDTAAAGSSCRTQARSVRPALTLARIKARCDSVTTALNRSHAESSKEAYKLAGQALDASLKLNPYFRESLIHRTNIALGLQDTTTALTMARRLLAVDPMNRTSVRMMAFSQQLAGKIDSTVHYLRIGDSTLVADVTISQFDSTDEGREVKGLITNGRSKPNALFKLVFEFVNLKNEVVATDTVQVAPIKPGESQSFELKPKGPTISAWRYRKEG